MKSPRKSLRLTVALATGMLALSAVATPASAATTSTPAASATTDAAAPADAATSASPAQQQLDARDRALGQITSEIARLAGIPTNEAKTAGDGAGSSQAAQAEASAPEAAAAAPAPVEAAAPAEAPAPAPVEAAAPAAPKPTTPAAPSYVSPVPGATLTAHFGTSGDNWGGNTHSGLDFAAPQGTPVKAVAAGTVASAGWDGAYGNRVVVKHSDGTSSTYSHLSGTSVRVGAKVAAGQTVGSLGSTGNSTGPHLHLEILKSSGGFVDPLTWLRGKGVSV